MNTRSSGMDEEYYKPTEEEQQNCLKGISCSYGICDECIVTHNINK